MAAVPAAESRSAALIDIPYELLQDPDADLSSYIQQGFGPDGLGALTISGIPGYVEMRQRLLPLAQQLATLPEEVKAAYEHPSSNYNFGWSHGKESLKPGVPDTAKGSFYANPCQDTPMDVDPATAAQYPSYYSSNIWPTDELPALEEAFKQLGQLIIDVGIKLMRHCDRYLNADQQQQHPGKGQEAAEGRFAALSLSPRSSPAAPHRPTPFLSSSSPATNNSSNNSSTKGGSNLGDMLASSQCHKARLLHYFPPPSSSSREGAGSDAGDDTGDRTDQRSGNSDAWCGWHLDHGTLTGLTCAMYLDAAGRPVPSPDPDAGLYIRTRGGAVVAAPIPPTSCAFQLGQVASIQSGGRLRATPHCVRAPEPGAAQGVSRNTYAVFMQPNVATALVAPPLPPALAALLEQDSGEWAAGMSFGAFAEKTMKQYYGGGAGAAAAATGPRQVLVVHE